MSGQPIVATASGSTSTSISVSTDDSANYTGHASGQSAWIDAAYNGSVWCAVAAGSRSVCRSTDGGANWTRTTNALPSGASPRRIVWVPWLNGGSGYFVVIGGSASYVSADGLTWTGGSSGLGSRTWDGIAFSGSIIVAADIQGTLTVASTTDGLAWTEATPTFSGSFIGDIAWGGGVFVLADASGGNGYCSTSTDGTSWTDRSNAITNSGGVGALRYGNGKFLAVGASKSGASGHPTAYTSTNGSSWSQGGELTGGAYSVATNAALTYNGAVWVSLDGSNSTVISSDDGATWSAGGTPAATSNPVHLNSAIVASFSSGVALPSDARALAGPWPVPSPTRVVLGADQEVVTAVDPLAVWLAGNGKAFRADLITVTLRDGSTTYRWTTSDLPLTYGGNTYGALGTGAPLVKRHGYTRRLLPAIDTFDLTLMGQGGGALGGGYTIGGKGLPQLGLEGYFDGARVRIDHAIMPVPNDFSLGLIPGFFDGRVSTIEPQGPNLRLRCTSDVETLGALLPRFLVQPQCGNMVFDANCSGVGDNTDTAAHLTIAGVASGVPTTIEVKTTSAAIIAKRDGYFAVGTMTFTSGVNNGVSRTLGSNTTTGGTTTFSVAAFPSAPAAGDTFTVVPNTTGMNFAMNRAAYTISGTISDSVGPSYARTTTAGIVAKATGYFNLGGISFTSGVNSGLSRAVVSSTLATGVTTLLLAMPLPAPCAVGDTFTVYPGCDRSRSRCDTVFGNLGRWRGYPHAPQPAAGSR